jgi:hypothetical protein
MWLTLQHLLKEGGNATSPKDISKMPSGTRTDILEQGTIVQTLIVETQLVSQPLISTLKPYSGDLQTRSKIDIEPPDPHLSNTDFESLTKKILIKAGGELTEQKTKKKNHLLIHSNSEVMEETHLFRTLSSPLVNLSNTQLLCWLNLFPHTLPDPVSPPSANFLCWLLECHNHINYHSCSNKHIGPNSWSWSIHRRNTIS